MAEVWLLALAAVLLLLAFTVVGCLGLELRSFWFRGGQLCRLRAQGLTCSRNHDPRHHRHHRHPGGPLLHPCLSIPLRRHFHARHPLSAKFASLSCETWFRLTPATRNDTMHNLMMSRVLRFGKGTASMPKAL